MIYSVFFLSFYLIRRFFINQFSNFAFLVFYLIGKFLLTKPLKNYVCLYINSYILIETHIKEEDNYNGKNI